MIAFLQFFLMKITFMWTDKGFFIENVASWLQFSNSTPVELAQVLGFKKSYYYSLVGKRGLSFKNLVLFANEFKISPPDRLINELIDWSNIDKQSTAPSNATILSLDGETLPFYNIKGLTGYPTDWTASEIQAYWFSGKMDFVIKVSGDNMNDESERSIPNDTVIGCKNLGFDSVPKIDKVYLITFRGGQPLVRVYKGKAENAIVLGSLNPKYEDVEIRLEDSPNFYEIVEMLVIKKFNQEP